MDDSTKKSSGSLMTGTNIAWFVAYLLTMGALVFSLQRYRTQALETYGTAEAKAEWEEWRSAAKQIGEDGPVARREPKSSQPPALVLMRDHFPACLGISLLLSSCLFGWMMVCVRGAIRPVQLNHEDEDFS